MGDVFLPRWLPLLGSDDAGYDNLVCNSSLIQNAFTADPAPTRYGHAWDDDFVKCLVRLRAVNEDAVSVSDIARATKSADAARLNTIVGMFAAALRKNPRLAWKYIGSATNSVRSKMPAEDDKERMTKLHTHFHHLFAGSPPHDTERTMQEDVPVHPKSIKWKDGDFDSDEIEQAIATLKNGKAPGMDNITNETLRLT